ncbi:hypothetical protein HDV06_002442 [Boothiomyces sp. JEL0866]|nr:hypothetical protein HDV06_002442 [Boothiomyces sp. JEL0866]
MLALFISSVQAAAFVTGTRCWDFQNLTPELLSLDPYSFTDALGEIRPANKDNTPGLPSSLYGTWWINGSQPIGLFSLAGITLDTTDTNGLTFDIPLSIKWDGRFSFDNSEKGVNKWFESMTQNLMLKISQQNLQLTYKLIFKDQTKTVAAVYPSINGTLSTIEKYELLFADEKNWILGKGTPVRRVVDEYGNVDQNMFNSFVSVTKQRSGSDQILLGKMFSDEPALKEHCKSSIPIDWH